MFGRFTIVAKILGRPFFSSKKKCVNLNLKTCLSPCPKRIRPLIKPLVKNRFSTNFQGTGPWEGPVHFTRFVPRVHNCSRLFQNWSWSQEKKENTFTKAIEKFNAQTFPKRIRPLIKPLVKNSFSTHFQGTGPWEGPVHFTRFVPRVHKRSIFFQSWSWSQEWRKKHLLHYCSLYFPLPLPLPLHLSLSLCSCSCSSPSSSSSSSSSSPLSLSFSLSLSLFLCLSLTTLCINTIRWKR